MYENDEILIVTRNWHTGEIEKHIFANAKEACDWAKKCSDKDPDMQERTIRLVAQYGCCLYSYMTEKDNDYIDYDHVCCFFM